MITRPATLGDLPEFLPNMKDSDVRTAQAVVGDAVGALLAGTVRNSVEVWRTDVADTTFLYGVVPAAPGIAFPWLLSTPINRGAIRPMLAEAPKVIERWNARWPLLTNWCPQTNYKARRWLEHSGFSWSAKTRVYGNEIFLQAYRYAS